MGISLGVIWFIGVFRVCTDMLKTPYDLIKK